MQKSVLKPRHSRCGISQLSDAWALDRFFPVPQICQKFIVTFALQSQPLVAIPERTPPELAKFRNFAIFANLFRRRDRRSLELRLRDIVAKGYLAIELVYRLRQKESLGSVKQKVVSRIQQNESALCFGGLVTEFLSS